MRKVTAITLAILLLLLVAATVAQFSQPAPSTPFPGPTSPGALPPTSSPVAP